MRSVKYLYLFYLEIVSVFYLLVIFMGFTSSISPLLTIAPGAILVVWDGIDIYWNHKISQVLSFPIGPRMIFFLLFFADWPNVNRLALIPFAITCILPIPNLFVNLRHHEWSS
jgi:hypothetical protein